MRNRVLVEREQVRVEEVVDHGKESVFCKGLGEARDAALEAHAKGGLERVADESVCEVEPQGRGDDRLEDLEDVSENNGIRVAV